MKRIEKLNLKTADFVCGVLFHSLSLIFCAFRFHPNSFSSPMKKIVMGGVLLLISLTGFNQKIQVLMVTGGHDFDREAFAELFDSMEQIAWEELAQPKANQVMLENGLEKYDVLVFYDMFQEISKNEQIAFLQLLEKGKPMLFLHHALVSYQAWDEFQNILGGRYYDSKRYTKTPANGFSTYLHDTDISVQLLASAHPITAGLTDFSLFDEVYGNTWVSSEVTPLLGTNHPESAQIIGWEHTYRSSRIIYIQPGHGKSSYENPNYRKLLLNALLYLAN